MRLTGVPGLPGSPLGAGLVLSTPGVPRQSRCLVLELLAVCGAAVGLLTEERADFTFLLTLKTFKFPCI